MSERFYTECNPNSWSTHNFTRADKIIIKQTLAQAIFLRTNSWRPRGAHFAVRKLAYTVTWLSMTKFNQPCCLA